VKYHLIFVTNVIIGQLKPHLKTSWCIPPEQNSLVNFFVQKRQNDKTENKKIERASGHFS